MLGKLRFSPGSLVLVRYSTYPIWPGVVQRNATPGYNRYVDFYPNRAGEEVVAYWVVFSGDTEGGWIPAPHIVSYHPSLVQLVRVSEDHSWYSSQTRALHVASAHYDLLFPTTAKTPSLSKHDRKTMLKLLELHRLHDDSGDIMPHNVDGQEHHPNNNSEVVHGHQGKDLPNESTRASAANSRQNSAMKTEDTFLKQEPSVLEALTYRPPSTTTHSRSAKQRGAKIKKKVGRARKDSPVQREIADLRECLRRRDSQISELSRETRRLRASRTSEVRETVRERDQEIARLQEETKSLRSKRSIAPASEMPDFEQWHRAMNPELFRKAAERLETKYTVFCGGVMEYADALERLKTARSALAEAYQRMRERTQLTEADIIDAEKALDRFGDFLKDVRFNISSDTPL